MPTIRPEQPADHPGVFAVNEVAFGRRAEAELVDAVRASESSVLSLVAEVEDEIVGHVLFSPVTIEGDGAAPASGALGQVGVIPGRQRQGVGSALIRAALERCPALGWEAIFVLGDPAFYARFGFELAAPRRLHYASHDFDAAFQCMELRAGALSRCAGWIRYADAFESVD